MSSMLRPVLLGACLVVALYVLGRSVVPGDPPEAGAPAARAPVPSERREAPAGPGDGGPAPGGARAPGALGPGEAPPAGGRRAADRAPHAEAPTPAPSPNAPNAPGEPPRAGGGGANLAGWLNKNPLSRSPHQVVRAWGGPPGEEDGPVGLQIVVAPNLSTGALTRLARDILAQYAEADVISARVYDSEEAISYDWHTDGGALAQRHLVAQVVRDAGLGVSSVRIRGREIGP